MKLKILYTSGTRADYGLMRSVLEAIRRHPSMELEIAVTGMHLMPEFGNTYKEILDDGYTCHVVDAVYRDDSKAAMASFIGDFIQKFVPLLETVRPDILLVLGDRGEMLGSAIAGAYMGIPVAHIHGGEVTSTADESARHAITKLAHIHFAATRESADRIIRMGEDPAHVFTVGAPGLDQVVKVKSAPVSGIVERYSLDNERPLVLVIQHPVPLEPGDPAFQMDQTLKAVCDLDGQVFVVYPNADAGGRSMIEVIRRYESCRNIRTFKSLPHEDYLQLLSLSAVIVGNSSSAIIEAPSFGVPAVNIGSRQHGRQKGENILDAGYDSQKIALAVRRALSDDGFKRKVKTAKNPYGDGNSSQKIVSILESLDITPGLLQKRMMY